MLDASMGSRFKQLLLAELIEEKRALVPVGKGL
jgi:hypothetical protein